MRGDIARLGRCTQICTRGDDTIKRSKPFKYAYEKEIVMCVTLSPDTEHLDLHLFEPGMPILKSWTTSQRSASILLMRIEAMHVFFLRIWRPHDPALL